MIGAIASHYVVSGGSSATAYSTAIMADTPLAYWRLGEASGTTMVDATVNGRNGTYSGGATLGATGLIAGDTCVDFGGVDGCGLVPNGTWMNSPPFTVEATFVADAVSGIRQIVGRYRNSGIAGSSRMWSLRINAGVLEFWSTNVNGGGDTLAGPTLTLGTRYTAAISIDGYPGTKRLYVNGAPAATSAGGIYVNPSAGPGIKIGAAGNNNDTDTYAAFDGRIDEVSFFGSRLTDARIAAHYAAI